MSIDTEEAFDKSLTSIDKNSQQTKKRRELLQRDRGYLWKTCIKYHTYLRLNAFSVRLATIQGCPFSQHLYNVVLEILNQCNKARKRNKAKRKDKNRTVFKNNMVVYRRYPPRIDFTSCSGVTCKEFGSQDFYPYKEKKAEQIEKSTTLLRSIRELKSMGKLPPWKLERCVNLLQSL